MKLLVLQTYPHVQLMFIMDADGVVFNQVTTNCGEMQHDGTIMAQNQLSYDYNKYVEALFHA